jgi:hypothetical protein
MLAGAAAIFAPFLTLDRDAVARGCRLIGRKADGDESEYGLGDVWSER